MISWNRVPKALDRNDMMMQENREVGRVGWRAIRVTAESEMMPKDSLITGSPGRVMLKNLQRTPHEGPEKAGILFFCSLGLTYLNAIVIFSSRRDRRSVWLCQRLKTGDVIYDAHSASLREDHSVQVGAPL